jgi:hypothetical protein
VLSANHLRIADDPLESLLRNLSFRSRNGSRRIGVLESTSSLSVLLSRSLSRANSDTGEIGTAARAAVGVGDASTSDELGAVSSTDVLSASDVGLEALGSSHGGNYERLVFAQKYEEVITRYVRATKAAMVKRMLRLVGWLLVEKVVMD